MSASLGLQSARRTAAPDEHRLEELKHRIEHAAHLLPSQGPITGFVHHNTLHAFEQTDFEDAVIQGGKTFGCHPYISEDRYRKELARERIRISDLEAVLRDDLQERADEPLLSATRLEVRMAMLKYPVRTAPKAELRWLVAESDALRKFRREVPDGVRTRVIEDTRHWIMRDLRAGSESTSGAPGKAREIVGGLFDHFGSSKIELWTDPTWESFVLHVLWRTCYDGVQGVRSFSEAPVVPVRHRDLMLELTGRDADQMVHEILIPFCAAFIDQGFADWSLPHRELGLFGAFRSVYGEAGGPLPFWMKDVQQELQRIHAAGWGPLESISESLRMLGLSGADEDAYLASTLLALRGWAGMIWLMETRSDRAARPVPPGSLIGFLAVRLLLDRCAIRYLAEEGLGYQGPLDGLRNDLRSRLPKSDSNSVELRAFQLFQVVQVLGWRPEELLKLNKGDWAILMSEIENFSNLARRRVFHLAYERRYFNQTLDAIAVRAGHRRLPRTTPRFQAMFCIDDREESLRRHLEEIAPSVETWGVAGFFGVAMYYRGIEEAHFTPLCPIVVTPQHYVRERAIASTEEVDRRRAIQRKLLGTASHHVHVGSRTSVGGALLMTLVGPLASIPLVARVLAPRLTGQIRSRAAKLVAPPAGTQLQLERTEPDPGPENGHLGYSVDEMASVGERTLRDMGFLSHFSRIIFVIGHGSNSMNNPHKAAYDCGACAGALGGPNGRAMAQILNDPRVRAILKSHDVEIPDDTVFVGGWHNTCDDSLTFYDVDRIPESHRPDFDEAVRYLEEACDRDAHERARRFMSARLDMTFEEARRHVQERAQDLSQTRPELGHVTNSMTIVGRRSRNRGLFLDRRAFLTSYDPTQDDEDGFTLHRILSAVIPVCAGISLEYYFSHVDNAGYGCGTKLPHNVASLLGVMEGPTSDLRTGLPWQMVEIHEPMRGLFVIETKPETMQRIMARNPVIRLHIEHNWVALALLDPDSSEIRIYKNGKFELYQPESKDLPSVATSPEWYRGWRDNLGFVLSRNALRPLVDMHSNDSMAGAQT